MDTTTPYALGVDIGTTYTAAAIWRDGVASAVPLAEDAAVIPSVLFLREDGALLVGTAAVERAVADPDRVARAFKRRIGDNVPFLLGDEAVTAEELTGDLLGWVVDRVTEREGGPPAYVTVTCPATWDEHRRRRMTETAAAAGLAEVGLLDEPVAAATYYAAQGEVPAGARIAVYDLGGGTFDTAVIGKTAQGLEVLGEPGGLPKLGGIDFDEVVYEHITRTCARQWAQLDVAAPTVLRALVGVRGAAVAAKEELSQRMDTTIPVVLPDWVGQVRLTRTEFEDAIRIPLQQTIEALRDTLDAAAVAPGDLRAVLLVGGSSQIPLVSRMVIEELAVDIAVDRHPKFAVCLGAAITAGAHLGPAVVAVPVTPVTPVTAPEPEPVTEVVPEPVAQVEPERVVDVAPVPEPVAKPTPVPEPKPAPPHPSPVSLWTPPPRRVAQAPPPTRPANMTNRGARSTDAAALLVPVAAVPAVRADLAASRLQEPADVPLRPSAPARRAKVLDRDELLVELAADDAEYAARARRRGLIAGAAVLTVLVLAGIVAAIWSARPDSAVAEPGGAVASAEPSIATDGTLRLTRAAVIDDTPGSYAYDVVRTSSGWVVGGAVRDPDTDVETPRLWRSSDGRGWQSVDVPAGDQPGGAVTGLAGRSGVLVASGHVIRRTESGLARTAAIWTSTDGTTWRLLGAGQGVPVDGTLRSVGDVTEAGGRFVAVAVDVREDREDGDGVLLTSGDGTGWEVQSTEGLSDSGPQDVRRLLAARDELWAAGSGLQGGLGSANLWHAEGVNEQFELVEPPPTGSGGSALRGLASLGGGELLAVGDENRSGDDEAAAWIRAGDEWRRLAVEGGEGKQAPVFVSGVVRSGDELQAVGAAGPGGISESNALIWRVQVVE